MKRKIFLMVVILMSFSFVIYSQEWWKDVGLQEGESSSSTVETYKSASGNVTGTVDWENGYIEVLAGGTVMPGKAPTQAAAKLQGIEAARTLAYRAIAEIVVGLQLNAYTEVENEMFKYSAVTKNVSAFIKGATQIGDPTIEQLPDGSFIVWVKMGIILNKGYGSVAPAQLGKTSKTLTSKTLPIQNEYEKKENVTYYKPDSAVPPKSDEKFTGLVIDAKGLGGEPSIYPRITTKSGQVVYGGKSVDHNYAVEYGVAGWTRDANKAATNPRVTNNPVTIKGLEVKGNFKSEFVIDDKDAALILQADKKNGILKQCKVMFVLD